jgi:hypothetical protein
MAAMNKTIFDVEDIREIRGALAQEYAAMPKDAAKALENARVAEEMQKIAQLRFIARSIDTCPNDVKAVEMLHEQA